MPDAHYKTLVGGVHGQPAVDALMQKANVVTVPGAGLAASRLLLKIGAQEWQLEQLSPADARQKINTARRKFGKNMVTPELLLKQDEPLFWSMRLHEQRGDAQFRRFLAGDIGVF